MQEMKNESSLWRPYLDMLPNSYVVEAVLGSRTSIERAVFEWFCPSFGFPVRIDGDVVYAHGDLITY